MPAWRTSGWTKRPIQLSPGLSAPGRSMDFLWYAGFSSCTNMHSYLGNILYKYKVNCCTCSEAFLILLPQLCEGIKTTAGYICADCSKCWDMLAVRVFRLVCVCFLFIQNVCLPLKDPIALGLENYPKIQQILSSSQPSQGYCCCSASPTDALWMLSKLRI